MSEVEHFPFFKTISLKYAQLDPDMVDYGEYCNDLLQLSLADAIVVNAIFVASFFKPVAIITANPKGAAQVDEAHQDSLWSLRDVDVQEGLMPDHVCNGKRQDDTGSDSYRSFLSARFPGHTPYSIPLYRYNELVGIVTLLYREGRPAAVLDVVNLFLAHTTDLLYGLPTTLSKVNQKPGSDSLKKNLLSRKRTHDILQSIDDVIWCVDLTTSEHYYGNNADRIFGYTSKELTEDKDLWWKMIHPEDIEQVVYKYDMLFRYTAKAEFEYRATRKDGIEVNIYTRLKIEKDARSNPVKVIGVFSDVTGLRNAERRLNRAQSIAKIGSWEFDLKTGDFTWSKQHYQLFEMDGVSGSGLYEAYRRKILPEDAAQFDQVIKTCIRLGTAYEFEYRILVASGEIRHILSLGECVKNDKDEVIGLRGTSQDITERKKIEATLSRQNRQIVELTEAVNQSTMVTRNDAAGKITFANELFCEFSGYELSELVNQSDRLFNSGHHTSTFWKELWDTVSSGMIWKGEIKNRRKNGSFYWVYTVINPIRDAQGEIEEYLSIRFDVTERKNAELELANVKRQIEDIIGNTDGALWSVDPDGRCLFVNHATARLTGYTIDELMNDQQIWTRLLTREEQIYDRYLVIFKTQDISEIENSFELTTKSDEKKWVLVKSRAMRNEANELVRVDSIMTDITKQVKYEEQIRQAMEKAEYANIAKTEFLSNMSHEIRTPMNAILGFADMLKGSVVSEEHERYLDGILAGGKGLMSLINDILDLSKIEAGRIEINESAMDIRAMMNELDSVFVQKARSKKLNLVHVTDASVPKYLVVDDVRLRQILFNLIGNAIKFTDTGTVSTRVGCSPVQNGKVTLTISISDTGIGIPKAQQEIIFEPFRQMDGQSTRKYGGTGLGLAITKRMVQIMNGSLEIESEVGAGTTITVHLYERALAYEQEEVQQEDEDIGDISFLGQTVLVVEDVQSNRDIIKGFLKPYDVSIIEVENGEQALKQMETVTPSLILMDMMMPVMDGYLTTRKIRSLEKFSKVPIIAVSAFALSHNEHEIRALCDNYIRKPFTIRDLLSVMKAYLPYSTRTAQVPGSVPTTNPSEKLRLTNICPEDKEKFLSTWKEIERLMSIDDIQDFSEQLIRYADVHNNEELAAYGKELLSYADRFDIENLNARFNEFPEIL